MNISAASAVTLLSRVGPLPGTKQDDRSAIADVAATVNGVAPSDKRPMSRFEMGKLSESLFNASSPPSVLKMKLDLFDRVGKAFGLKREDFSSLDGFGLAVKRIVEKMRADPRDRLLLYEIEKKLELPKLGLSIDDVIDAMMDEDGSGDDKLEAALLRSTDRDGEDDLARMTQTDELGLYRPAVSRRA